MALKTLIKTLEDVDESLRSLYVEADDGFILDIDDSDFKQKLGEFRTNNITLKKEKDELNAKLLGLATTQEELDALQEKFKDLDPEAAREALKTLQDQADKNMIDAGNIEELVSQRSAKQVKDLQDAHAVSTTKLQTDLQDLQTSNKTLTSKLNTVSINSVVQSSILDVAVVKKGAMKDVLARANSVFTLDDKGEPVAKDGQGNTILGKDGTTPMTPKEWSHSLVQDAPYLFEGSSGGGAGGDGGGGGGNDDATYVNSTDQEGINNSIADIAAGKVQIQQQT